MDLNGLLYDFDTDEGLGATEAGGIQEPSPAAAVDPGAATGEVVPPAAATETLVPPAPSLDPLEVQAELDALRSQNEQLAQYLQQVSAGVPDGSGPSVGEVPTLDPFADDFGQQLASLLQASQQQTVAAMQQMFGQVSAPLLAQQEAATVEAGNQNLADILADDVARNGEFASDPDADSQARTLVRTLAEQQFPEIAQRYGMTPRAAELAMTRAADQVRGLLRAVAGQAQTQQANQLATLAGVRGEPGVSTIGVPGAPEFTSPKQVVEHFATQARSLNSAA